MQTSRGAHLVLHHPKIRMAPVSQSVCHQPSRRVAAFCPAQLVVDNNVDCDRSTEDYCLIKRGDPDFGECLTPVLLRQR